MVHLVQNTTGYKIYTFFDKQLILRSLLIKSKMHKMHHFVENQITHKSYVFLWWTTYIYSYTCIIGFILSGLLFH